MTKAFAILVTTTWIKEDNTGIVKSKFVKKIFQVTTWIIEDNPGIVKFEFVNNR